MSDEMSDTPETGDACGAVLAEGSDARCVLRKGHDRGHWFISQAIIDREYDEVTALLEKDGDENG